MKQKGCLSFKYSWRVQEKYQMMAVVFSEIDNRVQKWILMLLFVFLNANIVLGEHHKQIVLFFQDCTGML